MDRRRVYKSDLPSDSEDTFFFSPDELEDYRREKRRRLIDRGREERLSYIATVDGQKEDPDLLAYECFNVFLAHIHIYLRSFHSFCG
ncbi:hypothetical protein J3R83DRAFT_9279 [Lanmaoa asiatica]|nr:hypothetical protein J3R83DRAFT_9279 [Lanmaoa asiatica]